MNEHVARILDDARKRLTAAERDAYLESACGGDHALRSELEELLRADGEGRTVQSATDLDDPNVTVLRSQSPKLTPLQPPTAQEGQMIGRYRLLHLIGEGGFGSVWAAEQREPVVRMVALKIIKLGMDTRQVIARFEAERQALAMMDHPNIAKVLDAGATESGRPYFVMELVNGVPMLEHCDHERLDNRARLDLFVLVCQAIQHAHQKGIIHRDIKPSNILVAQQDGIPVPKVIDFGIAKATNMEFNEQTLLTQQRQVVGTPAYMSPEQAEMSNVDIDTRSDIYSLGVLLYELLTGTTPFDFTELMSKGFVEVLRVIREVEPQKPSTRLCSLGTTVLRTAELRRADPTRLRSALRGDLDWIVMKCLEKDRTRRYETANGLAADIKRHLSDEPVLAGPPSKGYLLKKFVRRNRKGVIAGAVIAGVLILGVIGTTVGMFSAIHEKTRANDEADKARIAADNAERAAYRAQMASAANAVADQRMDAAGALLAATAPRLRGWEYEHLESQLDRSLPSPFPEDWRIQHLSEAASGAVAIHRTDEHGSTDWVVLNPDLRTQRLVIPGANDGVLALSPDGTRAVWVSTKQGAQRPAELWSVEPNKVPTIPIRRIHDPNKKGVPVVTWNPTGDRFALSQDGWCEVRDGSSGALIASREINGTACFTGDDRWLLQRGSILASNYDARAMRMLDAETLEPRGEFMRFESPIWPFMSFRKSQVACVVEDGTLRLLDIVGGTLRERLKIPGGIGNLASTTWSRDGRLVAAGSGQGRVGVWEAETGIQRGDFAGPQAAISSLWFLPDSGNLWTCDGFGNHRVWPITNASSNVLTAHRSFVYPVVLSKAGDLLLTGGWDGFAGFPGGLKFWDSITGALVAEYGRPGDIFRSADLTPNGRYAVAGNFAEAESNRRTEVIDLATGAILTTFRPKVEMVQPMCTLVHPDGRRAISTYAFGEAYVWDIFTGKILWEKKLVDSWQLFVAAAVSPDGRLIALPDRVTGIGLFDAQSYQNVLGWDAHAESITSLSFSPDGKWIFSTSEDDTIGVWEVATGKLVTRLVDHGADVLCAAMSPDGTRIASGGRDRYVRLWDTTHFENVAQLGGHKDYVFSLAWSRDGKQLFSGSGDSTVRIWDTRTLAEQVAAANARTEALPSIEARVAKALVDSQDTAGVVSTLMAAPEFDLRERELVRQVAMRFAFKGRPAYYRAPLAKEPIVIDGRIDEAEWKAAPWSEPFVDIEGDAKPKPRFETKMRMLWDDTNLYIAAKLEEPHVWATLIKRDDVIFNDNDFEVFVDPEGDVRWYGEVEVNALGTIFDLQLDRPYSESGNAHHEWSPPGMQAAASIDGTPNDPSDVDRGWTVEIAIPHSAFADRATAPMPPQPGDVWRINFSRVEWQHDIVDGRYVKRASTKEDNWVWTPQHAIDMHRPREWGFVEFVRGQTHSPK